MHEPTITCPRCQHEVKLTESLAAPLIRATEARYQLLMEQKEVDLRKRTESLRSQEQEVTRARAALEEQVEQRLASERKALAMAEAKKAREALADQLQHAALEREEIQKQLTEKKEQLAAAQRNESQLREERRKLQEAKEQFELEKQRAIDAERSKIREEATRIADEQGKLKLSEKEKTIADLQGKLQEALRKAEQGSQQLQGEVQELQLESLLKTQFPFDLVEPVAKGEFGGDALQRVATTSGAVAGSILWESKRTKTWSDTWLAKLRNDMRSAQAAMAVLVTQALPKGTDGFGLVDQVWVTSFRFVVPLAVALRETLIQAAAERRLSQVSTAQQERLFAYLTGTQFRHRVNAIFEHFQSLKEELESERKFMQKRWAKREININQMIEASHLMQGELQAMTGRDLWQLDDTDEPSQARIAHQDP